MRALDRLATIVVTATLTSAVWIVAGGTIMQHAGIASGFAGRAVTAPPAPAPAPSPPPARPLAGAKLVIPVQGKLPRDLADTFPAARSGGRVHDAIDIMAAEGTPVIAAAPGKVEKLFLSKPGGMTIYVRSPDGRMIYYYAHLQGYAPGIAERQPLRRGQVIGYVGSTGNASADAPHLHFAIFELGPEQHWWEGTALNPYPVLRAGR